MKLKTPVKMVQFLIYWQYEFILTIGKVKSKTYDPKPNVRIVMPKRKVPGIATNHGLNIKVSSYANLLRQSTK